MNLQDLRIAVLTRAPRPNVWDLVALILVKIGRASCRERV